MAERQTHRELELLKEIQALQWPGTEAEAREVINLPIWTGIEEPPRTSPAKHAANAFSERLFRQFPGLLDEIPDAPTSKRDGSRFVATKGEGTIRDKWGVVKWAHGEPNPNYEEELARRKRESGVSDDE